MDIDMPRLQQMAINLRQSSVVLRLAATAGWQAGNRSAECGHRSRWIAADWSAAANAASAFLELNLLQGDAEFHALP